MLFCLAFTLFGSVRDLAPNYALKTSSENLEGPVFQTSPALNSEEDSLREMVWETSEDVNTLDPHRCYPPFGNWISENVYETLFTHPYDSADNTKLIPLLAESVDISDDGLNYTFSLRSGVKFHDGTFFDAEAVKYNIERLMAIFDTSGPAWMIAEPILGGWQVENAAFNSGPGSQEHIDAYNNWIAQEPIIVMNSHTVRIRLHSPFVPFLHCLAYKIGSMVSPSWIESHGGIEIGESNEYVDSNTCGTGPYTVAEYFEGLQITLAMNDDYWRKSEVLITRPNAASLEKITINIVDDSWTRHANLVNGASDGCWLPRDAWGDLWNPETSSTLNPDIDVNYGGLTSVIEGLGFNLYPYYTQDGVTYENPFHIKDFRVACSYAFDYATALDIWDENLGGLSTRAQGCIPIGMFGHNDNLFQYEHDLELAVAAWNDAMAAGLDDILADNSYTLSFFTLENLQRWFDLINSLKVGIYAILTHPDAILPSEPLSINVIETDITDYIARRNNQELIVTRVGWAADYYDPDNYAYPFYYGYGFYARGIGFDDADVNTWYEQSRVETDQEIRRQLFYQIQQKAVDEVAYLMLAQAVDINFQRNNVKGYSYNPMRPGSGWRYGGPYFYHMWKEQYIPPSYNPQSTIIWETDRNPSSLDPHICYELIGNWISDNVYETLFTYSRDSTNTDTLLPLLAESVDISENGQEYTFHLREGVTFHDGTSFNAAAVKYNIERALAIFDPWGPAWMLAEPLLGGRAVENAVFGDGPDDGQGGLNHQITFNAWKADNDAGIGALWVIDDYTIMMRLAYSYTPFLKALTYEVGSIISPTWIENHGGYQVGQTSSFVGSRTCGTGPYQVHEYVIDNHIILTKNQNYWAMDEALTSNPKAGSIDTVVIRINADEVSREEHLLQGETDGCLWPIEDAFSIWDPETRCSTNPTLQVWSDDLTYTILGAGFNLRQYVEIDGTILENPFYLKDLRIALSYAFNYAKQIEDDLYTLAVQAQGPIPRGMWGHDDNLFMYTYNLDLAVQAWNDAMELGLDLILASYDHTLRFYRNANWWGQSVYNYIEQGLMAILAHENAIQPSQPLNIEIVLLEQGSYDEMRRSGNMLIIPVGWAPDYPDPDNYALGFTASYSVWARWIGYGTETTDEWIQLAAESMVDAERLVLYQQIQQAVVDEVAYIWAVQRNDFHVERWDVHGYSFNPVAAGPYFYYYWKDYIETKTSWWWKNEFSFVLNGQQSTYDIEYLESLVVTISLSSEVFSQVITMEDAFSILAMDNNKGPEGLALRELLGVWLNLANDALLLETGIDLSHLTTATIVEEAILECEILLLDPTSSARDFMKVMRICQELNAGRFY